MTGPLMEALELSFAHACGAGGSFLRGIGFECIASLPAGVFEGGSARFFGAGDTLLRGLGTGCKSPPRIEA